MQQDTEIPKEETMKAKAVQDCSILNFVGTELKTRHVPSTFRISRDAHYQLAYVNRTHFTEEAEATRTNTIVTSLKGKVSITDFMAFSIAASQTLSNQSYQYGNTQTYSGKTLTKAKKLSERMGMNVYNGDIEVTLKDLCKYGYGETEPTTKQKRAMANMIDILHNTPVVITYPNGDKDENVLCSRVNKHTRAKDGAVEYHLFLSPIFCSNVAKNFGELPQDIIKRLRDGSKRLTEAHYVLAGMLGVQAKGEPFTRFIEDLVNNLGLLERYKNDRSRTEKQLLSLFDAMQKVKLITGYEIEYETQRGKKCMNKVTFHISTRAEMLGYKSEKEGGNKNGERG